MPLGLSLPVVTAGAAAARMFDYAAAAKKAVACALCGQAGFKPLASIDRYGMGLATVKCRTCGLVQTRPRLTAEAFDAFYRDDYRAYDQGMFQALRSGGFAGPLLGFEPGSAFRDDAAERYGAEIVAAEAEMPARWRGSVGVASMIHVLEHVADPVATLVGLRELPAPVGPVYIDVPDVALYSSLKDFRIAHVHHSSATTPGRPSRPPGSTCCASTRTGRPAIRRRCAPWPRAARRGGPPHSHATPPAGPRSGASTGSASNSPSSAPCADGEVAAPASRR